MYWVNRLAVLVAVVLLSCSRLCAAEDSGFKMAAPAVQGDLCYDFREGALGCGPSYTVGTFGPDRMCELKGMWVIYPESDIPNKLGGGVAVSVPALLRSWGVENIPAWFNSSVGALLLLNLDPAPELSVGVFATLLNIPL